MSLWDFLFIAFVVVMVAVSVFFGGDTPKDKQKAKHEAWASGWRDRSDYEAGRKETETDG